MRLGDLDALKEVIKANHYLLSAKNNSTDYGMFTTGIMQAIDNAPSVDLWQLRQEATENALKKAEVLYGRPQGEWKLDSIGVYCNQCNTHPDYSSAFCPNCGAKMKGGTE